MAIATHIVPHIRRYSQQAPRDPHFRLKASLMSCYLVGAFTLPFVPPLLETRRTRRDGSYLTRYGQILSHGCLPARY
ncbi:uncharacterized protein BDZ99DRAFT_407339 [Mytilinidion resinicola]|uniref:Uncharacterized protein n=1 Tax=Mytilinidion resinicola TaxID=574789 RepID=A0A6A6Z5V3_9PEZI|nr:uncharacterized protein BDZ99DRAFT_407339 [Mytilinidion resinicola]KAF2816486.1 hypothetical protein BDZ99DRAFT_407339 [Mytilinidion resinicola]